MFGDSHRDDGACHKGCWYKALHPDTWEFDREAYISLADEFDPMGADPDHPPLLAHFDPTFLFAARHYAEGLGIEVPWDLRSLDEALRLVGRNERMELR